MVRTPGTMAEDPEAQCSALERGLNLRHCHLGSQEPSTQSNLKLL